MEWKEYEREVCEQLKTRSGFKSLQTDIKLLGISKVKRQLDILVETENNKKIAIECKYYNRKVDIKTVDSFIGFLLDINVSWGIIITTKGYTTGAYKRTRKSQIQLDVMSPEIFNKTISREILAWGRFVYQCIECKQETIRYCSDLDFKIVEVHDDRSMGAEYWHSATWIEDCPKCNNLIDIVFDIIEYPPGDQGELLPKINGCLLLETGNFLVNSFRDSQDEELYM